MRTTIRMNEDLARRAKQFAARTNRTFTQVVEEAVATFLSTKSKPASKPPDRIVLPVVGDPARRMGDEEYRAMIEEMCDEEAERIMRRGGVSP